MDAGKNADISERGPNLGLADINHDAQINLCDLAVLLGNFGLYPAYPDQGDTNRDGTVDLSDLAELLAVYGNVCP